MPTITRPFPIWLNHFIKSHDGRQFVIETAGRPSAHVRKIRDERGRNN